MGSPLPGPLGSPPMLPPDALRSDVRNVLEEVLADHFIEVRCSLREDLREELQKFHTANRPMPCTGKKSPRLSGPPAPRGSKFQSHVKKDGSPRTEFPNHTKHDGIDSGPLSGSMHSTLSSDEEGDQHEWMFRHFRRFNAGEAWGCGDGGEGARRARPSKKPRMSVGSSRHSDAVRSSSSIATDGVLPVHDLELERHKAVPFGARRGSASANANLGRSNTSQGGDSPPGAWVGGREGGSGSSGGSVGSPDSAPAPKGFLKHASMRRLLASARKSDSTMGSLGQATVTARRVVRSQYFDYFICALIAVNALTIGVQTNYAAAYRTSELPSFFYVLEVLFCLIFAAELLMRLCAFRLNFFRMHGWEWNIFDFVVVQLQIVELFLGAVPNLSFVRMLRVVRLVRAVRLIRILRYITELRALVASIGASLTSLVWTLVLLVLMIYMLSLFTTQLVVDHRLLNIPGDDRDDFADLVVYYGTLYRSMLSLFQAVSGGLDWDACVAPLMDHISVWLAPAFSLYVAFTLLALMNVVTAMFVDSVLETTKKDKNAFMANNVRELFTSVDGGVRRGAMDWDAFQSKLDTRPMIEFFKSIDLDRSEANNLFRLLDLDNGGSVDAEEFLSGCLRLRGPAKALDLALLISEVGRLGQQMRGLDCLTKSVDIPTALN